MKRYLYDQVKKDLTKKMNLIVSEGSRFENMVACHLLKWCHYREDTEGFNMELRYFRDVDRREVDFVVLQDRTPIHFVECKSTDTTVSSSLRYLSRRYPGVPASQLHMGADQDVKDPDGIRICHAMHFLKSLV